VLLRADLCGAGVLSGPAESFAAPVIEVPQSKSSADLEALKFADDG